MMQRRGQLSQIWVGFLMVCLSACWPAVQEDPELTRSVPTQAALTTAVSTQAVQRPTPPKPVVPTPLPTVTSLPNYALPENWQEIGSQAIGLSMAAPADWVNIGQLENIISLANKLEQDDVIFLADEVKTGVQIMTGRELETGAFAIAFRAAERVPASLDLEENTDPVDGLNAILARIDQENQDVVPVRLNSFPGAYAEVNTDPTGLLVNDQQLVHLKLALFIKPETGVPTYLLMGAAEAEWERYDAIFNYMLETIIIYDVVTGAADGMRLLDTSPSNGYRDSVVSQLQKNKIDFWIFNAEAGRYVTIAVNPGGESSDLTLTLLAPSGRTVAQQDSGYGGDSEILADVLLPETGAYIIQVSEFFNESDSYSLTVSTSTEPQFGGGGRLEVNQQIEATLRPNGDDLWVFDGQAGQSISIVLTPIDEFDGVFTLYGPDGSKIVTYDEGYSGDAEVLAGYILPVTGEYSIVVNSFSDNGGDYLLAVDEDNEDVSNFFEAGDLIYGTVQQEVLQTDEAHIWFLEGRAGDEISLIATPVDDYLDLDVWLLDPELRRLVMQDASLAGEPELITYILPRDGQYIVVVQDFFREAGTYNIELTVSGENYLIEAGEMAYDQTVSYALQVGRGTLWSFNGREGDVINIVAAPTNAESDLVISLRDANGEPAVQVDNTLAGNEEILTEYTLTSTGVWSIIVQEYSDSGGNYTLTLTEGE